MRFKAKARKFVEQHHDHIALLKLRRGDALTQADLAELERMPLAENITDQETIAKLNADIGLGGFLRLLTGLDRVSAMGLFSSFVAANDLNANQNEFISLVIDSLCENGVIDPKMFYESPFADLDDMGIIGVFGTDQTAEIIRIVRQVNQTVAA